MCAGGAGIGEKNGKLFTAHASHHVAGAPRLDQQRSNCPQNHVSGKMAVRVVHLLEVIEIHREQRELAARSCRAPHFARERLVKAATIEAAGERVGEDHARQLRANAIVRQPYSRDCIGPPVRRRVVLARKIADLGLLEQTDDCAQPAPDVPRLHHNQDHPGRTHRERPHLLGNVDAHAARHRKCDDHQIACHANLHNAPGLASPEEEVCDMDDDDCAEKRTLVVLRCRRRDGEHVDEQQISNENAADEQGRRFPATRHERVDPAHEEDVGQDDAHHATHRPVQPRSKRDAVQEP